MGTDAAVLTHPRSREEELAVRACGAPKRARVGAGCGLPGVQCPPPVPAASKCTRTDPPRKPPTSSSSTGRQSNSFDTRHQGRREDVRVGEKGWGGGAGRLGPHTQEMRKGRWPLPRGKKHNVTSRQTPFGSVEESTHLGATNRVKS